MKKFEFGSEEIIFDDDFLFYYPYWKWCTDFILINAKEFEDTIRKLTKIEDILNRTPNIAQEYLDKMIDYAVGVLVNQGIYEYDKTVFKNAFSKVVEYKNGDLYNEVCDAYRSVEETEKDLKIQRAYERANRSRWQGGGFGIRGAIKGAVKAGALNIATDSVRGIGDAITNASDKSKINDLKSRLVNDKVYDALTTDFRICGLHIMDRFFSILSKRTGRDYTVFVYGNSEKARAIFNNSKRVTNAEQKLEMLKESILLDPLNWDTLKYCLDNSASIGVKSDEIFELMKYLTPDEYSEWLVDKFFEEYYPIKNKPLKEKYDLLKKLGIKYQFITNDLFVVPQCSEYLDKIAIGHLDEIAAIRIEERFGKTNKIDEESLYELQMTFNGVKEILLEHHLILSKEEILNEKLPIKENEIALANVLSDNENTYQKEIINRISTVQKEIQKRLKDACIARGTDVNKIDNLDLFRKELIKEEEIYYPGRTYADYESEELKEVISRLKKQNFGHNIIKRDIYNLEEKNKYLEQHEKTIEFKRGKKLLKEIDEIGGNGLYKYRGEDFLKEAKKFISNKAVQQKESAIFPVLIYDEKPSSDSISGFVITEINFYIFGMTAIKDIIPISDIVAFSYDEKKNAIGLDSINGKRYLITVNNKEIKAQILAECFSRTFDLKETTAYQKTKLPIKDKVITALIVIGFYGISSLVIGDLGLIIGVLLAFLYVRKTKKDLIKSEILLRSSGANNENVTAENQSIGSGNGVCPNCGEKISKDAQFCEACGHKIDSNLALKTAKIEKKRKRGLVFLGVGILLILVLIVLSIVKMRKDNPDVSVSYDSDSKSAEVEELSSADNDEIIKQSAESVVETENVSITESVDTPETKTELFEELRKGTYVYDDGNSVYNTATVSEDSAGIRVDIESIGYGGHQQGIGGGYLNSLGNGVYTCYDENDYGTMTLHLTDEGFSVITHPNEGMETMYSNLDGDYIYSGDSVSTVKESENEFILPNSNSRYLTDEDVKGLGLEQIRLAINEIYARHGRAFQTEDLNEYFSSKSWYTPLYSADEFAAIEDSVMNDYEKENIKFLAAIRDGANTETQVYNGESMTMEVVNCNESITLREAPDTSAAEICQIPLGSYVEATDNTGTGFTYVIYTEPRAQGVALEYEGYVLSEYLAPAY